MRKRSKSTIFFTYVFLAALSIVALLPFIVAITTSFKERPDIYNIPFLWLPRTPTWQNYYNVLVVDKFVQFFLNSLFIAIFTTIITITLSIFAAFGFSRFRFKGRNILKTMTIAGYLVPTAVLFLPFYILMNTMNLIDNLWSLILTYSALTMPISLLMLISYFSSIPTELDEAAMIDGSSRLNTLARVIIPLASPGIVSVSLFCFISSWQEFLFGLIFINDVPKRTLALALVSYKGIYGVDWGNLMAATVFAVLPTTVVFVLFQKWLISGLTQGAIKG